MCEKLFKIISKHGAKYQFGYITGVGCQDGTFMIKTILHIRQNYNLPTWVEFADLVKAFKKSNYAPLIVILVKYVSPPKTMLSNQTNVQKKYSQAHHQKY